MSNSWSKEDRYAIYSSFCSGRVKVKQSLNTSKRKYTTQTGRDEPPPRPSGWCTSSSSRGGRGNGRIPPRQWTPPSLNKYADVAAFVHSHIRTALMWAKVQKQKEFVLTLSLFAGVVSGLHQLLKLSRHWNGNLKQNSDDTVASTSHFTQLNEVGDHLPRVGVFCGILLSASACCRTLQTHLVLRWRRVHLFSSCQRETCIFLLKLKP